MLPTSGQCWRGAGVGCSCACACGCEGAPMALGKKRLADRPAADSSTAAARGRRTKPADEGMASGGGSRKIASVTDWIPSQIARRGF